MPIFQIIISSIKFELRKYTSHSFCSSQIKFEKFFLKMSEFNKFVARKSYLGLAWEQGRKKLRTLKIFSPKTFDQHAK